MSAGAGLKVTDVAKTFAGRPVLRGVSVAVDAGRTVAIVGPSGSGKSTLLNIIGALEKADSGAVMLGSIDVGALRGESLAEYRAARVGFVFQDHHLLPQLTALENVLLPTLSKAAVRARSGAGRASTPLRERAEELMVRLGVSDRSDAFPAQLSGGERQRVAVARALINSPDLLLCDEPTGNLDAESGAAVVDLLAEAAQTQSVSAIMVTHNVEHAARFGRCFRLRDGRLEPDLAELRP